MLDWFLHNFGKAIDAVANEVGTAIDDGRHAVVGGWFGPNFEPHPARQQSDLGRTRPPEEKAHEPETAKPEREQGIDR